MHSQTIYPGSEAVEHNTNVQNTENDRLAGEQYCNTQHSEYICMDYQSFTLRFIKSHAQIEVPRSDSLSPTLKI